MTRRRRIAAAVLAALAFLGLSAVAADAKPLTHWTWTG